MVMKIRYLAIDEIPSFNKPLCLALGYFDGIHVGHVELIKKTISLAKENDYASGIMTFDPDPFVTLGKVKKEQLLTTINDRAKIVEEMGIDYFIILKFSKEVAKVSPKEFINYFIKPMNVKAIVCGFDYYFGHKNQGTTTSLVELSHGKYQVHVIEKVTNQEEKISSSRIIDLLQVGNISKANELLGRKYAIKGIVMKGRQVGRQLGFPTANIDYNSYILPKNGVYHVVVKIDDRQYLGMCNIGVNPTISMLDHVSLEVNIFNFNQDIYDKEVEVIFIDFIRDEKQFSSREELIQQLTRDANTIKERM